VIATDHHEGYSYRSANITNDTTVTKTGKDDNNKCFIANTAQQIQHDHLLLIPLSDISIRSYFAAVKPGCMLLIFGFTPTTEPPEMTDTTSD